MNYRDLVHLIHAYDGYQDLKSALGFGRVGFGYEEGVFGKFERIEQVICNWTGEVSTDERVAILDGGGSAEERAKKLLGTG